MRRCTLRLHKWALLFVLGVSLLTGCASQPAPVGIDTDRQLLAQFASGAAVLDCEAPCSSGYVHSQREIWSRYEAHDWRDLALIILHIGWHRDITYYFLGAAAQGLGHPEAADRYYRIAGTLASGTRPMDKCASVYELCGPLSLPQDIYPRLTAVDQQLISRGERVDPVPPVPGPQPSSPNGGWVDPPPLPR